MEKTIILLQNFYIVIKVLNLYRNSTKIAVLLPRGMLWNFSAKIILKYPLTHTFHHTLLLSSSSPVHNYYWLYLLTYVIMKQWALDCRSFHLYILVPNMMLSLYFLWNIMKSNKKVFIKTYRNKNNLRWKWRQKVFLKRSQTFSKIYCVTCEELCVTFTATSVTVTDRTVWTEFAHTYTHAVHDWIIYSTMKM